MRKKLILYGAGQRCRELYRILKSLNAVDNLLIVDSNSDLEGSRFEGHYIRSADEIKNFCDSNLCITIADHAAIKAVRKKVMYEYGYDEESIIGFNQVILNAYTNSREILDVLNHMPVDNGGAVLFDCHNGLVLGGVESWSMDLCSALIMNGNNHIYIISDNGEYDVSRQLREHILMANIDHQNCFSKSTVINLVEIIMNKMPCQVVTCAVNEVMLAAYLVKKRYPNMVRIIAVIHNSVEEVYEEYFDFKECPDLYIGVSQDIEKEMITRGIITQNNIYVMTCPFECEETVSREYSEDMSEPIRIGYAGRIEYSQKRMDLVLKFLELMADKQIHFVMEFAGDGLARSEMEKYIMQRKLDKNVRFLGRVEHSKIKYFWRKNDVCINLSDFEGRSISIIEAMGNGAVPVVTATSGVREDITDQYNGYIVPLGDYRAVADRIEYLSQHREELRRMGERAHQAVYPKSHMEAHLKFWEGILGDEMEQQRS
jgi:glycosyltransferase involved in cell wall biosynthesis